MMNRRAFVAALLASSAVASTKADPLAHWSDEIPSYWDIREMVHAGDYLFVFTEKSAYRVQQDTAIRKWEAQLKQK